MTQHNPRINNSHLCISCSRRADGLAVGRPGHLGWFCNTCGPDLAQIALAMAKTPEFDIVEQRAANKVAELSGLSEFTLTASELPDFIKWAVTEFGEAVRKELEGKDVPF